MTCRHLSTPILAPDTFTKGAISNFDDILFTQRVISYLFVVLHPGKNHEINDFSDLTPLILTLILTLILPIRNLWFAKLFNDGGLTYVRIYLSCTKSNRHFHQIWPKYLLSISPTEHQSYWASVLLSISAQIYKRANHVHSTPFYDWCESSFGTNFHVCIWRLNSIDTRTNTFCKAVRCKYRCWQVPAGVVTGVNKPSIKFWVDIVRGETRLRPQFLARN